MTHRGSDYPARSSGSVPRLPNILLSLKLWEALVSRKSISCRVNNTPFVERSIGTNCSPFPIQEIFDIDIRVARNRRGHRSDLLPRSDSGASTVQKGFISVGRRGDQRRLAVDYSLTSDPVKGITPANL